MDMNPQHPHGRPFFVGPGFDGHHGGAGSTLDWVIFALQLLMLAALAVLIARAFVRRGPRFAGGPPPYVMRLRRGGGAPDSLEILRLRYARGEISRDDYLQAHRDLGGAADAPTEERPTSEPT